MKKQSSKIITLLSGGMDSTTLLWHVANIFDEVYVISFDYGQRHKTELKYAKELVKHPDVTHKIKDHIIVEIPHYKSLNTRSALLAQGPEVPTAPYTSEIPSTNVPSRNLVFLSIASSFANELGIEYIGIGVHATDSPYPDCRPEFITAVEAAINAGSPLTVKDKKRIHVYAPFLGFTKADIAYEGLLLNVPYELTYSCYKGTEPPCGECATCIQRNEALEEAKKRFEKLLNSRSS